MHHNYNQNIPKTYEIMVSLKGANATLTLLKYIAARGPQLCQVTKLSLTNIPEIQSDLINNTFDIS